MVPFLEKVCLWIKEYRHALRVTGGLLFAAAFLAGIFWMAGWEIEPTAFTLGMLSSLFLASPSIAEYFLPERKPVREMTFEEILEFIPTTHPTNDWHGINTDWIGERFLKEDPRLRFSAKFIDDGIQNSNFKDKWANRHPHEEATGYWYNLYYDGAFLDRIVMVSIDGGRAIVPCPDIKSGKIEPYNYFVGKLFDSLESLDEYIKRSDLEVNDS